LYVDYVEVGRRIAKRRRELGYKQWFVTEKANLSDKYLSNIERGKSVMSIDVLMRLCQALEITPDYLLTGALENKTANDFENIISEKIHSLNQAKLKLTLSFIDWVSEQEL